MNEQNDNRDSYKITLLNNQFTELVKTLSKKYTKNNDSVSYSSEIVYYEDNKEKINEQIDDQKLLENFHFFLNTINSTENSGIILQTPNQNVIISSIEQTIFELLSFHINLQNIDEIISILQSFKEKYLDALYETINDRIKKTITELTGNISFDFFYSLSMTNYETRPCLGSFLICHDFPLESLDISFEFDKEKDEDFIPDSKNIRFFRKLLELTDDNTAIVLTNIDRKSSDKLYAVGITRTNDVKDKTIIRIKKGSNCYISFSENKFIQYEKGKFYFEEDNYISNINIIESFINDSTKATLKFINKIQQSANFHGALLIFLGSDNNTHINDLCSKQRGILVNNINNKDLSILKPENHEYLINLCKIDGAIVFNKQGKLVSIGTVLDGIVKSNGKRSRGARYNSTIAFLDSFSNEIEMKAVIISEDKDVTILDGEKYKWTKITN